MEDNEEHSSRDNLCGKLLKSRGSGMGGRLMGPIYPYFL